MELSYRFLTERVDLTSVADRFIEEGSFWALEPSLEDVSAEDWAEAASAPDVGVIGVEADGEPAGIAIIRPFCPLSQCGEIALAAFRTFSPLAVPLARGVVEHIFTTLDCVSLIGKVPDPNRHAKRLCEACGFVPLGHVPGLMWYARKRAFVGGWLYMATPETLKRKKGD